MRPLLIILLQPFLHICLQLIQAVVEFLAKRPAVRIRTLTDPLGNTRQFAYDANSRLAAFTDRSRNTSTFGYDPVGNVSEIRNGAGEAIQFTYDGRNQLRSIGDGLGTSVNYDYDAQGRLTSVTDALGKNRLLGPRRGGKGGGSHSPGWAND